MPNGSFVSKSVVIDLAERAGITVTIRQDGMAIFVRDQDVESLRLEEKVARKIVHRISRKFGIAIHLFWNPQEIGRLAQIEDIPKSREGDAKAS